ncbi:MAG: glycosyltransferase [Bacteroidales bacterium]|nr:glycosyltransferase [Bacteroidales bacterium]
MNLATTAVPRLLHIIPFAALGGTEKDCFYFIESSKDDYNHTIWLLGEAGPMIEQWKMVGADVNMLNILNFSQQTICKRLSLLSLADDYDGILYWSTIKLPLIRYALRNQRCRMAVHVGNPANFDLLVILKQMFEHVFYSSSIDTCLFACSGYVLQTLKIHPYYRHFKSKISYNPVRLLRSNSYKARIIEKDSNVIIGMTARLDPIKDHRTLLLAFKKFLNYYPRAQLWLLGDGALRESLQQLVIQLNIAQQVIFWGNVDDVYEKLLQMDIFVYSTTPKEGLGNAVSEAMACGLPCIVSDLPMMHEIAGVDSNAVFFKPGNVDELTEKMLKLIADAETRNIISHKSFERAIAAFDAKRYVNERIQFLMKGY